MTPTPIDVLTEVATGFKYALIVVGALLSLPIFRLIWRIARDWGEQTEIVRRTGEDVATLTDPKNGVVARLARQEYILTGDGGVNGVRGDVKRLQGTSEEIQTAQRAQAEKTHIALGHFENRLTEVERRVAEEPRRKSPRKPPTDRRRSA